jgi:P2-related tail formation protein
MGTDMKLDLTIEEIMTMIAKLPLTEQWAMLVKVCAADPMLALHPLVRDWVQENSNFVARHLRRAA